MKTASTGAYQPPVSRPVQFPFRIKNLKDNFPVFVYYVPMTFDRLARSLYGSSCKRGACAWANTNIRHAGSEDTRIRHPSGSGSSTVHKPLLSQTACGARSPSSDKQAWLSPWPTAYPVLIVGVKCPSIWEYLSQSLEKTHWQPARSNPIRNPPMPQKRSMNRSLEGCA